MAGAAQAKQDVIRIVLADDDEGFLESLRALVEEHPSLSVEATATDGVRATELVQELDPDALVIDLHMPRWTASRRSRSLAPSIRPSASSR